MFCILYITVGATWIIKGHKVGSIRAVMETQSGIKSSPCQFVAMEATALGLQEGSVKDLKGRYKSYVLSYVQGQCSDSSLNSDDSMSS